MNEISDAKGFLEAFAKRFGDPVQGWVWGKEDDDFGRQHSFVQPYAPDDGVTVEVNASFDLQLTQAFFCISERDMSEGADANTESVIVFEALIQFEDKTVTLNGAGLSYTEADMDAVIRGFLGKVPQGN